MMIFNKISALYTPLADHYAAIVAYEKYAIEEFADDSFSQSMVK